MPLEADNTLTLRSQHFPLQHQRGTDHVNTEHITSKQNTSCLYPLTPSSSLFSNTCIYSANRASRGYFVFPLYSARKTMLWLLGTCFLCSQTKKLLRVHLWILSDGTCNECAEAYKVPHAPGYRCSRVPYIKVRDKHMLQSWSRWIHILSGCSTGGMGSYLQSWSGLTFSYFRKSVCDKLANETARSMRFRRKHVRKLDIPQN